MFKLTSIPEADSYYEYIETFISHHIFNDDIAAEGYLDGSVMPRQYDPVYGGCVSVPLMVLRDGHGISGLSQ